MNNACRTSAASNCISEVWNRRDNEFRRSVTERLTISKVRADNAENSSSRRLGSRWTSEWNLSLRRESFNSTQRPFVTSEKVAATNWTCPDSFLIGYKFTSQRRGSAPEGNLAATSRFDKELPEFQTRRKASSSFGMPPGKS